MRDFSVIIGCVIGLALIVSLVAALNSTAQESSAAMEMAQLRADAAAAQAESTKAKAEVDRLKSDLKKAVDNNKMLAKRVADLERQLGPRAERKQTKR